MHVEKRATNKFGIVILVIAVLGAIIGGGYYLIKHKDSLNLDFNIKFPWQKEEEETEIDIADNGTKQKKDNSNRSFVSPISISNITTDATECKTTFKKIEDKPKEIIIHYETINYEENIYSSYRRTVPCEINMYKFVADGFEVPGESKLELTEPEETKEGEIVFKKSDFEKSEIYGIRDLKIYYEVKEIGETFSQKKVITVSLMTDRAIENTLDGVIVSELSGTKIKYYKTVGDKDNNYIYFIIDNSVPKEDIKIRVKKLLINGEVFDASYFEKEVLSNTKSLIFIEIPKKDFSSIKNFTISFFKIVKTKEGLDSYYISGDYHRDM